MIQSHPIRLKSSLGVSISIQASTTTQMTGGKAGCSALTTSAFPERRPNSGDAGSASIGTRHRDSINQPIVFTTLAAHCLLACSDAEASRFRSNSAVRRSTLLFDFPIFQEISRSGLLYKLPERAS